MSKPDVSIEIYSTCPGNTDATAPERPGFVTEGLDAYLQRVIEVARWSEQCGCKGILIYIDNSLVDNWFVAQIILQHTKHLVPLIATQPVYMHPYWVAKKIATLGFLHGRAIALNMLAGAFRNDLLALNDATEHDQRYVRMTEYTQVIQGLLSGPGPFSHDGAHYKLANVFMKPPLDPALRPEVLMSGSSEAGMAAARQLGATVVRYPKPVKYYEREPLEQDLSVGIRLGIIARQDEDEAWEVARARFPEDRKGQLTHALANRTSDSVWHKQLSGLTEEELTELSPYWLGPFLNYKTFCPYLVGSYPQVADVLARYVDVGFKTFITDIPSDKEELLHQKIVFELAQRYVAVKQQGAA
ncbi:MAG: LLM class flavin-dependent oxidoreductase [Planctomycetota bacterium]|jgi:alkanesulfonate monooxygenase